MQHQEITEMSRAEAERRLQNGDPKQLLVAVVAVALHELDLSFAQTYCGKLAVHTHPNVRGNAILGFGHLARRFGELDLAVVTPLVESGLNDQDKFVRSQAHNAADDIEHFLKCNFGR